VNVSQPFIAFARTNGSATQALAPPFSFKQRIKTCVDFRDAKAMAHTRRAALATKGQKVTNSESLKLIAHAFGVADWNTLSAVIREDAAGPHNNASAPEFPTTATMHQALAYAVSESSSTRHWSISCSS
jgi:hypothetical protein